MHENNGRLSFLAVPFRRSFDRSNGIGRPATFERSPLDRRPFDGDFQTLNGQSTQIAGWIMKRYNTMLMVEHESIEGHPIRPVPAVERTQPDLSTYTEPQALQCSSSFLIRTHRFRSTLLSQKLFIFHQIH